MIKYTFEVSGYAADNQTWTITGETTGNRGDFPLIPSIAMREAFAQLTNGKAVYGKPGIGCNGPYRISRMLIEEVE